MTTLTTQPFVREMGINHQDFYGGRATYRGYLQLYDTYVDRHPCLPLEKRIGAFVVSRRLAYGLAWNDQTAHEYFRPLPKDMPSSYGQCVPAHCTLRAELGQEFSDQDFVLSSGRVLAVRPDEIRQIIPAHVWINWQGGLLAEDETIDVTADQSRTLPPVVMETHDRLAEGGVIYHNYRQFANTDQLVTVFAQREPAIRQRLGRFSAAITRLRG